MFYEAWQSDVSHAMDKPNLNRGWMFHSKPWLWQRWILTALFLVALENVATANILLLSPDDRWLPLLQQLESGEREVRRAASEQLSDFATTLDWVAVERIASVLKTEQDAQVRLHLFELARLMGKSATPMIPILVEILQKENRGRSNEILHQEHRAALALASIGEAAVPGLRELLTCKKNNVRAEACLAIGKIGDAAALTQLPLIELLRDENERVRSEAAYALTCLGNEAINALVQVATAGSPQERQCALIALGSKKSLDERIATAVRTNLSAPDVSVRVAALHGLANVKLDSSTTQSAILDNLQHENEDVRRAAVHYLTQLESSQLLEWKSHLLGLLQHPDKNVAGGSAFVLRLLGSTVASQLIDRFSHGDGINQQLVSALAMMGPGVVSQLAQRAHDENPRIRAGCLLALGQVRPLQNTTLELLIQMLEDESMDVQLASISAIGDIGPRAKAARSAMEGKLVAESSNIRRAAVQAFFQIGDRNESNAKSVLPLLNDDDHLVQLSALHVLRSLGASGRIAIDRVAELLENHSHELQSAAIGFLGSHGKAASHSAESLVRLLERPDVDKSVKLQSLQALARFGSGAATGFERVQDIFLHEPDMPLRLAALEALTSFELPFSRTKPALQQALTSDNEELRKNALRSMRKFGTETRSLLVEIIGLIRSDEKDDSYVMRELQRQEKYGLDEECVPGLLRLLSSDNPKQILASIRFLRLAQLQNYPEAQSRLAALQNHGDLEVKNAIAESLRTFPPNDRCRNF